MVDDQNVQGMAAIQLILKWSSLQLLNNKFINMFHEKYRRQQGNSIGSKSEMREIKNFITKRNETRTSVSFRFYYRNEMAVLFRFVDRNETK